MATHEFNIRNHVPGSEVEERDVRLAPHARSVVCTLCVHSPNSYVVAVGQIGLPDADGFETFVRGSVTVHEIQASSPQLFNLNLPINFTDGYWAVGIFYLAHQVPFSDRALSASAARQAEKRTGQSTNHVPEAPAVQRLVIRRRKCLSCPAMTDLGFHYCRKCLAGNPARIEHQEALHQIIREQLPELIADRTARRKEAVLQTVGNVGSTIKNIIIIIVAIPFIVLAVVALPFVLQAIPALIAFVIGGGLIWLVLRGMLAGLGLIAAAGLWGAKDFIDTVSGEKDKK